MNPDRHLLSTKKRSNLDPDAYIEGLKNGERVVLSRAITLIESAKSDHKKMAQEVIERALPLREESVRIGITGVPGVGKSTFIESLGNYVIREGRKLAVLAIDPSSLKTKGSILGDKTRMETLSNNPGAFIRPSPTSGSLGGVTRKTRESIILCEAAGYDTIFIETVGVGQSETAVHSMVDFFLLLMLAGAGDELQGIKRGIMEMADLLVINKIDEVDKNRVQKAENEYRNALQLYPEPDSGWTPKITTCSALEGKGIKEIWEIVADFIRQTKENGYFKQNRRNQAKNWMYETIHNRLKDSFYDHDKVKKNLEKIEKQVLNGETSPTRAAEKLLQLYSDQ